MSRALYTDNLTHFVTNNPDTILGELTRSSEFPVEQPQRDAWLQQIRLLQPVLKKNNGSIFFEYTIPRLGERIDVVLIIGAVIFVLEFKVGEKLYSSYALDQVCDYALDLKNFHKPSHECLIAPILIATKAKQVELAVATTPQNDKLLFPIKSNIESLELAIDSVLAFSKGEIINRSVWEHGSYCPTPTIIEAAMALYKGHSVAEISRSDASAINLHQTTDAISAIIQRAKQESRKAICFVTGVPGAGKTLIGLNIATKHLDHANDLYSVFLSGNGPLVMILQEALARDKVQREKAAHRTISKKNALSEVKLFIQNVHHYRDAYLIDPKPPVDHVALFDEAQRAWDLEQTASFMRRKKNKPNFNQSEPEFLISCIDRHPDWGVIVCLVGGGQEINTGEAGIGEWIRALHRSFPHWHIHISDRLVDSEYGAGGVLESLKNRPHVDYSPYLHLSVSMRSFRTEHVSLLIKQLLDLDIHKAQETLALVKPKYQIVITRDLNKAKQWLKEQARGSERYGIVVSSQAERLKPHAIDVRSPMNPVHWFLAGKDDVRSSFYLEDVATEFHIQGLELDWVCVTWDADFSFTKNEWQCREFRGNKWVQIRKEERKGYLKNAYRVLLTRARQGMAIVIPPGDSKDPTRTPAFYDSTFSYLREIGFDVL